MKEGVEDFEEGREVSMAESKEKNDEGEPIIFREKGSFEFPKVFPLKLLNPGGFSIPYVVGKVTVQV